MSYGFMMIIPTLPTWTAIRKKKVLPMLFQKDDDDDVFVPYYPLKPKKKSVLLVFLKNSF